jgi:hypothetical protein
MAGFAPRLSFPSARPPYRNPGCLQIAARRLATNPGLLLNPPQRPTQPPQRNHLLPLRFAQDIPHANRGYLHPGRSFCLGPLTWPVLK